VEPGHRALGYEMMEAQAIELAAEALVLRVATIEGRRRALAAGAGICCGLLTWGVLASAGLAAVLAHVSLLAV
jgi:threonine/homoserine/homoserine lactone efflux protein